MTRRWWLPAALSLALAAGCGGGEPSPSGSQGGSSRASSAGSTAATVSPSGSPSAAPRRLTPEDDGGTFTMDVGRSVSLVVSDASAEDPEVSGDAVQLVQVVNVTASGVREWEVRAERPGTSTITSGSPRYTITIVVW